jgi:hypothetical protein
MVSPFFSSSSRKKGAPYVGAMTRERDVAVLARIVRAVEAFLRQCVRAVGEVTHALPERRLVDTLNDDMLEPDLRDLDREADRRA